MTSSHYAMLQNNSRSLTEFSYYNMRCQQAGREESDRFLREAFEADELLRSLTDSSPLDWYARSDKIQKIDPQAHKFLALRKRKFKELTKELAQKQGINSCAEAHLREMSRLMMSVPIACMFLFPINVYVLFAIPATPGIAWARLNYKFRANEMAADERTLKEATEEELKGGIRFYQACQKVEQVLWKNKSLLGKLFSSAADSRAFRSTPFWKDRTMKTKKKLESLGKKFLCTEEDQKIIALLQAPIQGLMKNVASGRF